MLYSIEESRLDPNDPRNFELFDLLKVHIHIHIGPINITATDPSIIGSGSCYRPCICYDAIVFIDCS